MSEHQPRPTARLAAALSFESFAHFVNLRELYLASDPVEIEELERLNQMTQENAILYFNHAHEWDVETQSQLDACDTDDKKAVLVGKLLSTSKRYPLFVPLPEA